MHFGHIGVYVDYANMCSATIPHFHWIVENNTVVTRFITLFYPGFVYPILDEFSTKGRITKG